MSEATLSSGQLRFVVYVGLLLLYMQHKHVAIAQQSELGPTVQKVVG